MKVDGRFLVRPISFYENMKTWGEANDVWIEAGLELGEKALCRALVGAGLEPRDLSAIFVTSVTGIAAPSLDARLANRMGLSPNIKRIPDFRAWLRGGRRGNFARGGLRARLSGSGGGAAVGGVVFADAAARRPLDGAPDFGAAFRRWRRGDRRGRIGGGIERAGNSGHQVHPVSQYRARDGLGHLRKGLSHRIVAGSSGYGGEASRRGRGRHSSPSRGFAAAISRAGSCTRAARRCSRPPLRRWASRKRIWTASWECLRKVGNISSTSVLLVLEDVYMHRRPEPGTLSILAAMGPGFCAELVLLRW